MKKQFLAENKEDVLSTKIKEAKTHKALLQLLVLENNMNFSKAIDALEGVVYNDEKISLTKIKEMI